MADLLGSLRARSAWLAPGERPEEFIDAREAE